MIRVLSGIVMAAGALAAILFLPPVGLRVVVSILAAMAAFEYMGLVGVDNSRGRPVFLLLTAYVAWALPSGVRAQMGVVALFVLFLAGALAVLFKRTSGQQAILGAFSVVYIGMPLGMLAALQIARDWPATVLLIATVVVSDSLQFYSGRMLGRHPLAPAISPKKTVEGAIGGVVAGTLFMTFAGPLVFREHSRVMLAVLGLVMVLLGILGDLFESRLKREANMKDSSSLIPGLGGVLDRIDALLCVTPAFVIAAGVVK
jgi:phosphatidate cytidylyltransferase